MSGAVGIEPAARPKPRKWPWPWNDRAGRLSWLKAVALLLEVAPAVYYAAAWATGSLGPRPVTEVIHGTGLIAIRFLLLSLLASPVRAIANWQRVMLIRRQLGLTALFYTVAHLVLFTIDQKWALLHVASEILLRFYLTIGFVALLGLVALGVTSTDGMVRRLGRGWKRLHRLAYLIAVLGVFHFFLQSKSDVSEANLLAGIVVWLMGWRLLSAGADRAPLPMLGLGLIAALLTAGVEFAWFALATKVDPRRPLLAELDWRFAPHPAGQMLILGVCAALAVTLAWASRRERWRGALGYDVAVYAGAAAIAAGLVFAFSLSDAWLPDAWPMGPAAALFVAAIAALGVARWALPPARPVLDALCAACVLAPIAAGLVL